MSVSPQEVKNSSGQTDRFDCINQCLSLCKGRGQAKGRHYFSPEVTKELWTLIKSSFVHFTTPENNYETNIHSIPNSKKTNSKHIHHFITYQG